MTWTRACALALSLILAAPPAGGGDPEEALRALHGAARALAGAQPSSTSFAITGTFHGARVDVVFRLELAADGGGRIRRGAVTGILEDEWVHVTHAQNDQLYSSAEQDGETFALLLGLPDCPVSLVPEPVLRRAALPDEALAAFQATWQDEVAAVAAREVEQGVEVELRHMPQPEAEEGGGGTAGAAPVIERITFDRDRGGIVERRVTGTGVELTIARAGEAGARPPGDAGDTWEPFVPGDRQGADLLQVLLRAAGEAAPDFRVPLLGGGEWSLAEATRDSVVVLDFFATWCAPCRRSLKEVAEFERGRGDVAVQVVAVNVAERLEGEHRVAAVDEFWRQAGHPMKVALDLDDRVRLAYGVAEIPVTMVVGRDGVIRAVHQDTGAGLGRWLAAETRKALER